MKSFFFLIIAVFCLCTIHAQSQNYSPITSDQLRQLTHSSSRFVVSLAGEWERSTDAGNEWAKTSVPRSETAIGRFQYRRSFRIDAASLKKYTWHLYCLGVNYKTEIRLNGQYLGSHVGGTTPFAMRVSEQMLKDGLNTVEFTVSNELNALSTTPLRRGTFGAKTFGGVTREAFLVGMPHVWVSDFGIQTTFNNEFTACNVSASAVISSGMIENLMLSLDTLGNQKSLAMSKTNVFVEAELRDPQTGAVVAKADAQNLEIEANRNIPVRFKLNISSPHLWSPEHPNLYTLNIQIKKGTQTIDEYSAAVGLRDVRSANIGGKQMLVVNGQTFEMKGVDYIEDKEASDGTLNMKDFENDVIALKTLGANVVRVRHSSPHPYFVHLCNKYGLFLLLELPVVNVPDNILGSENFIATAQNIQREMLLHYDWQPATLGYGISDCAAEGTSAMELYSKRLVEIIRGTSSKLVYKIVRSGAKKIIPQGFDFLVFSVNIEDVNDFRKEVERLRDLSGGAPFTVSYGKAVQPLNHNGYSDPLSVESQAKYVRDRFRTIQEAKLGDGSIVWAFNDYSTDRPVLITNNQQSQAATAGLTSRSRDPRLTYDMLKALFNDEKEPPITAGTFKQDSPIIYTVTSIIFLIVFFVLMNGSRRFRENVIRALLRPYNFYADIRDQRILSNVRTFILAVILASGLGLMISSLLFFLRQSYKLDYILTLILPYDWLKDIFNTIIWIPLLSSVVATLIFLACFLVIATLIRLGSFFVRSRIFFSDAFVISVWAGLPMIFLLILTMGLFKILEFGNSYTEISFAIIVGICLWFLYRVLRGAAVIYDVRAERVYAIGIGLLVLVFGGIFLLYDAQYATISYMRYFIDVLYR